MNARSATTDSTWKASDEMSKLPAFQFYPGDWMKDSELRLCSIFARGLLVDLLCLMFEAKHRGQLSRADGETPLTDFQIADAVSGGTRDEKVEALNELLANGVLKRNSLGIIYSSRLLRDEEIRQDRRIAGSKGGSKRQANAVANGQAKLVAKSSPSSSSSDEDGVLLEKPKRKRASVTVVEDSLFDEFWSTYPRHTDKAKARKAWASALKKIDSETILVATERFKKQSLGKDQKFLPHPTTWLNGERWDDETLKPKDPFAYLKLPPAEREAFVIKEMYS